MQVSLRIQRMNPEVDKKPYYQLFQIEAQASDRVLDALLDVKHTMDSTLAVRKSCAHGICGSDAMRINGIERLACKTLISDVISEGNTVITLEPLRNLPIERDLMVDQASFFEKYMSVSPFLIRDDIPQTREIPQSPVERAAFEDQTKCILCSACYSACPVIADKNPDFIGPAASLQASRFVFDSRDTARGQRLSFLDSANGVHACDNHFDCTRVCPRGIKITKSINATKREIKKTKS